MLSLYRPFNDLLRYETFPSGFGRQLAARSTPEQENFSPAVDIVEFDKHYEVSVELPGVKPENIEIETLEQRLTLRGNRVDEREEKSEHYRRSERVFGKFERSFSLPKGTPTDAIEARVEAGILVIHIPKPLEVKAEPRRIEVKGEGFLSKAKKAVATAMETPIPTQ